MDEIRRLRSRVKLKYCINMLRPKHWIKNLFVLAPLMFSGGLVMPVSVMTAACAFLCFCISASSVYVFNDLFDMERDKLHPVKKKRPLASGIVGRKDAILSLGILLPASVTTAFILGRLFGFIILAYLTNNLLYTLFIKRAVILDAMSVAAGFLLRVAGGAAVINGSVSPWLILCTFLLALLLGLGKRKKRINSAW